MPTRAPVPVALAPGGAMNPVDWIDLGGAFGGADQTALMRGQPGAMAPYQRRQVRGPETLAQGREVWLQSRPYDRGAAAFSPKFGQLAVNPIGAGVYAPHKLPVIAGPGARYEFGAIWFDVQAIPTTVQMSPTMPIESVDALLATSSVAGMYVTTG